MHKKRKYPTKEDSSIKFLFFYNLSIIIGTKSELRTSIFPINCAVDVIELMNSNAIYGILKVKDLLLSVWTLATFDPDGHQ